MKDWLLYTSTDMVNWTDHGEVASLKDFKWVNTDNGAWAPQVIERNGKFYMYCPMPNNMGIGVLVADSPYGPFTDPIGKPLIKNALDDIDPTVFIDDDGQAYLYWGNPNLWYAKLNEDMITLASPITKDSSLAKVKDKPDPFHYQKGLTFPDPKDGRGKGEFLPKITFPWKSPWRVIIIGNLNDIVASTLMDDVAPPSIIKNTDWIKPGAVSWNYWSDNHGTRDFKKVCEFADLAVTFTNSQFPHLTSYGHELALSVLFESALQHFADRHEGYYELSDEPKKFLREVPVSWDKTILLQGFPGKEVVLARNKNTQWYIGGINGENTEKNINIKFDFLDKNKKYKLRLIKDGKHDKQLITYDSVIESTDSVDVKVLRRGGFVAVISPL